MARLRCLDKCWLAAGLAVLGVHGPVQPAHAGTDGSRATYEVEPGDVLGSIAERYGVSLGLLRKVNAISTDTIRPGQVLLLPTAYEVKPGDALGTIAERHGVKLSDLLRYNDLNEHSVLKVGQQLVLVGGSRDASVPSGAVPEQPVAERASTGKPPVERVNQRAPKTSTLEYYLHEVRANEVLSTIAARYAVSTADLRKINRLRNASLIRIGQQLKIPITTDNAHLTQPKPWTKYARTNFERGKITLTTMGGDWSGRVFDARGKLLPDAKKNIQSLLASWETGRKVQVALDPGLYRLIVQVSDEFGGRPIRVVSGYRQRSYARNSKHRSGRALDFSIPGVPNTAVVDYLLTLQNTGVGYYPNTTHVHMDVRGSSMYWVDASGPGQAPRYVHKSKTGERGPAVSAVKPAQPSPSAPATPPQRSKPQKQRRHRSSEGLLASR